MLSKNQLVAGTIYATLANASSGNGYLYIGRFKNQSTQWEYICTQYNNYSNGGDLTNNCFKEYRVATWEEQQHFLTCSKLQRYVKQDLVTVSQESLYPIF